MPEPEMPMPNDDEMRVVREVASLTRRELNPVSEMGRGKGYVVNAAGAVVGLDLFGGEIDDAKLTTLVGLLASLKGLTQLSLWGARVYDLSPLTSLTGLTQLDLTYTRISDLSPLTSLTGLTDLNLSETRVNDLSPLMSLTG